MRISPKLFSLKKYFSFSSVKRRPNKWIEFSGPFFFNLSEKLHGCKTDGLRWAVEISSSVGFHFTLGLSSAQIIGNVLTAIKETKAPICWDAIVFE